MSWSQNAVSVLGIIAVIMSFVGGAAAFAIFVQIIRQRGWKLAEPSVIQGRWQMHRPWLFAGAVIGLLFGIAFVFLNGSDQKPPAEPNDVIILPPFEIKSQPRDAGQPTD